MKLRIALVTEELPGVGLSGGIGAAFDELALSLSKAGHFVDLIFAPSGPVDDKVKTTAEYYAKSGVRFLVVDPMKYSWDGYAFDKKSYSTYEYMKELDQPYDFVHFHEYKGLGMYAQLAKRQGLAFEDTVFVIQCHGPTRWAIGENDGLFSHQDQLRIDFMERKSIELADVIVSPSQYLLDWMAEHDFLKKNGKPAFVIKNVCSSAARQLASFRQETTDGGPLTEIVFFARHEARKGMTQFCDALDKLNDELAARGVLVTFLGRLGRINGRPSGVELTNRAAKWRMPIQFLCDYDRTEAMTYLARNEACLVVVPSPRENSPYAVFETVVLGKPLIASNEGGGPELIDAADRASCLTQITGEALAARILACLQQRPKAPRLATPVEEIERQWLQMHLDHAPTRAPKVIPAAPAAKPRVVLGITHHERPQKLSEAILTALRQDYKNLEIVVVDDGSKSKATLDQLDHIETVLTRAGGRLIRQENKYLGGARNAIAAATKSDYIIFLDDDDLAFSNMVSTLVKVALRTQADIVGCFNLFLEEAHRAGKCYAPEAFEGKLSYAPTGGPLSICAIENCLGAATALIKRSHFEAIGGYTEVKGVGFEDYEFYMRSVQSGASLEIAPIALYLYEVGRPSMISRTSMTRNFERVVEAMDFSANTEQWRDFIGMESGRRAHETQANRIAWEYSSSPHGQRLTQLLQTSNSHPDYLSLLAAYADETGSANAAAAWRSASEPHPKAERSGAAGAAPKAQPRRFGSKSAAVSEVALGDCDLLLAADLRLGRGDDALKRLLSHLDGTKFLDRDLAQEIDMVVAQVHDDAEVSDERLRTLLAAIKETEFTEQAHLPLSVALILLERRLGGPTEVRRIVADLFSEDELQYLESYPEVAGAVRDLGMFPNGMAHFKKHGYAEGRPGYRRLSLLAQRLSTGRAKPLAPWMVWSHLGFDKDAPVF